MHVTRCAAGLERVYNHCFAATFKVAERRQSRSARLKHFDVSRPIAPTTQALKYPDAEAIVALPEISEADYMYHHTRKVLFFPLFTK